MNTNYENIYKKLIKKGWKVKFKDAPKFELNTELKDRYKNLPNGFVDFISILSVCTNPTETSWLLTEDDYNGTSDSSFKWNEFEVQSLDAAKDDADWSTEIKEFWNRYFTFLISVKSGYAYFAIDLFSSNGKIVLGREPEFEEIRVVADSLEEFLGVITEDNSDDKKWIIDSL